jgi:hypothetical protein
MIKIQISRSQKRDEVKKTLDSNNLNDGMMYNCPPSRYNDYDIQTILETEITEKQFEAIRKEVLKNF